MSTARIYFLVLCALAWESASFAADAKPAWQTNWEQTVAAAKKEGAHVSSGGGSFGLIKGGPHPNASKLFINWFLSRRGQIALQKYEDLYGEDPPNSRRVDIPKDMLPASSRLVEGRRYFDFSDAKHSDMTPIFQLVKDFMKGREGK